MQVFKLETGLAIFIMLVLGTQSSCLAANYVGDSEPVIDVPQHAFHLDNARPKAVVAQNGQQTNVPLIQRANCGSIGPEGEDFTTVIVLDQPVAPTHPSVQEPLPFVPIFLVSMLSLSMVAFGIRSAVLKKRAPIWVLGSIAAGAVGLVGFIWLAFSGM